MKYTNLAYVATNHQFYSPLKVPMKKMAPLLVSSIRYTKGVSQ